ncbi:uncharacterized protein C3orf84 homolog [Monodelphis domestica]|uniref:Chromosome 6 C3orf84 homolog n=1 Tax=Monodelphis domestica TaxID=13616 RepID=F7C7K6_MONDO|nr:uncharacterized protein C3orf84 homolog [Monodelphis domestica]
MTQSAIVGSWHNTGFYGHYRGQFKYELAQDYRLAAKPQPPAVFLQRMKEPAGLHLFSKHDNRGVFDPGLGRRKSWQKFRSKRSAYTWPTGDESKHPLVSSYQKDYMKEPVSLDVPLPQPLVHYNLNGDSEYLDANRLPSTTYQHNFCHHILNHLAEMKFKKEDCETKEKLRTSSSPAPIALPEALPDQLGTVTRKKTPSCLRLTVSDCLQWLDPLKKTC